MSRRDRPLFERQAIDDAKAAYNISDVAARWVAKPLQKAGHEKVGLCLFHQERTASMRLNDAKGTFYCFGCGSAGDIVDFIQDHLGLSFVDTVKWLGAAELPPVDPAERAKLCEAEAKDRLDKQADAVRFWNEAGPVAGTPAEVYLRARGITIDPPPSFRFGMVPSRQDAETKAWGPTRPALIGACQDGSGAVVGIQRIFFLREDPTLGKAAAKLSLGKVKGAALRLGPPAATVMITEGPEDGLSILQDQPDKSIWVVLGTAMFPFVELPDIVSTIIVAGQNDKAGEAAVSAAAAALGLRGLIVGTVFPDAQFKDWNDWLRGVKRGG